MTKPSVHHLFNGSWDTDTTTNEEDGQIIDHGGMAGHDSYLVIVDPEFNERWALCWVRMNQPNTERA